MDKEAAREIALRVVRRKHGRKVPDATMAQWVDEDLEMMGQNLNDISSETSSETTGPSSETPGPSTLTKTINSNKKRPHDSPTTNRFEVLTDMDTTQETTTPTRTVKKRNK